MVPKMEQSDTCNTVLKYSRCCGCWEGSHQGHLSHLNQFSCLSIGEVKNSSFCNKALSGELGFGEPASNDACEEPCALCHVHWQFGVGPILKS